MKKSAVRDYAVDCFRLYETLKRHEDILQDKKYSALLSDYNAVERTFKILENEKNGAEIAKAVKLVYCKKSNSAFKKNEISQNVLFAASKMYCSEMTVYRYLKYARDIFCDERGLRHEKIPSEFN